MKKIIITSFLSVLFLSQKSDAFHLLPSFFAAASVLTYKYAPETPWGTYLLHFNIAAGLTSFVYWQYYIKNIGMITDKEGNTLDVCTRNVLRNQRDIDRLLRHFHGGESCAGEFEKSIRENKVSTSILQENVISIAESTGTSLKKIQALRENTQRKKIKDKKEWK